MGKLRLPGRQRGGRMAWEAWHDVWSWCETSGSIEGGRLARSDWSPCAFVGARTDSMPLRDCGNNPGTDLSHRGHSRFYAERHQSERTLCDRLVFELRCQCL